MLLRSYTCRNCQQEFEQSGPGRLRRYCPDCKPAQRRTYARGPGLEKTRRLDKERKRLQRLFERQARSPRPICNCGRDYLTVPIDEQDCPCQILT